jgi:hypothetical protein
MYLQGIKFSPLTIAKKTQFKNLGSATSNLVIYQSSTNRIQTYARKLNSAVYAKHKWLSGCAEKKCSIMPSH